MGRQVDQMLCRLLGAWAGTRLVPRDFGRLRLLEHGSEPASEHGMRGKRANDPRPVFYPYGISNKGWLGLRRSLREPESATCKPVAIGVRHAITEPQATLRV